jgi:hypothetical protein
MLENVMKKIALAAAIAAASVTPVLANDAKPADDLTILSSQGAPIAGGILGGASITTVVTVATLSLVTLTVAGASSGTGTN